MAGDEPPPAVRPTRAQALVFERFQGFQRGRAVAGSDDEDRTRLVAADDGARQLPAAVPAAVGTTAGVAAEDLQAMAGEGGVQSRLVERQWTEGEDDARRPRPLRRRPALGEGSTPFDVTVFERCETRP
ncbi:MAG: hypothetical protein D6696_00115 [Acidobacteria bacterium]|nr:MAG: hypothetical protein D6696_00115 [Acidobacteriota bacterium]